MKQLREYFEIAVFIILIGLTILSSINIAKVKALRESVEYATSMDIVTEVDGNMKEIEGSCKHNWVVLDKEQVQENGDVLLTCKSCGELRLVDYLNHLIRKPNSK